MVNVEDLWWGFVLPTIRFTAQHLDFDWLGGGGVPTWAEPSYPCHPNCTKVGKQPTVEGLVPDVGCLGWGPGHP